MHTNALKIIYNKTYIIYAKNLKIIFNKNKSCTFKKQFFFLTYTNVRRQATAEREAQSIHAWYFFHYFLLPELFHQAPKN
jgi:hypothetical protein